MKYIYINSHLVDDNREVPETKNKGENGTFNFAVFH